MIGQVQDAEAIAERLGITRSAAAILAAYVELIEELGTEDVSTKVIARRAGVAERTIFRHYPQREELLLGTVQWAENVVFSRPELNSIFDVPVSIRASMLAYQARPELAYVVAEAAMRGASGAEAAPRKNHFEQLLSVEVPSLTEQRRAEVVLALCHLDSATAWAALRREFGMGPHDASDAAAWAAEAVLNPLRVRTPV